MLFTSVGNNDQSIERPGPFVNLGDGIVKLRLGRKQLRQFLSMTDGNPRPRSQET